jgi:hypothetical protein
MAAAPLRLLRRTGPSLCRRFGTTDYRGADPFAQTIATLHAAAVRQEQFFYSDPETNLMVMTELASLKRGRCCGNSCRHCAYRHSSVLGDAPAPITTPELEAQRAAGLVVEMPLPEPKELRRKVRRRR